MKNYNMKDLDVQGMEYIKEMSVIQSSYIFKYRYKVTRKRLRGPKVLELGIGHGSITNWLSMEDGFKITSIDASQNVIDYVSKKVLYPERVSFIKMYFEDFETDILFDDILFNNCLEHVDNPVSLLSHIKRFLKTNGRIHITVPNAMSLHRMLGKEMGLIEKENELNDSDAAVGHQRVYDINKLRKHVIESGLFVLAIDGIILKPFSNSQMVKFIDLYGNDVMDGLFKLGHKFPKNAAELYFCCTARKIYEWHNNFT